MSETSCVRGSRRDGEPRFQIRPMTSPADLVGKALVHYTSWQETYTGLMDPRALAGNTLEYCREIARRYPENTFVLLDREQNGRVAGFACCLQNAASAVSVPGAGEVTALYILRAYQGLGLGRMLMEYCLERLQRPSTVLFVLKGNDRAIGFYEHMGFRLTGEETTCTFNGGTITELEMVYQTEG